MKKSFILSVILAFSLVSCISDKRETSNEGLKTEDQIRDDLYQKVIQVHDTAMLKMEVIVHIKNKAIKEADSLRDLSDESLHGRIDSLENKQIALEEANTSMMVWMRAFRPVPDTISHQDAMKYLEAELDKITQINSTMDQVIEEAGL